MSADQDPHLFHDWLEILMRKQLIKEGANGFYWLAIFDPNFYQLTNYEG